MSLFELIEAPHRVRTAPRRLTAMTFSMRQQKLDRFCPGYKIVGLRLTKFPASPVALALAGVVVAGCVSVSASVQHVLTTPPLCPVPRSTSHCCSVTVHRNALLPSSVVRLSRAWSHNTSRMRKVVVKVTRVTRRPVFTEMSENTTSACCCLSHRCKKTLERKIFKNIKNALHTHTYTHTRLTALFPGLPGWAGTRKVKAIWILLKQETVSGSGISWAYASLNLAPDR